jgi:AraC-like DNA-binding protein/quercetin dioxygenase-like cupin family protein
VSQVRQIRKLTLEQEPYLGVRSFATTYSSGHVIQPHTHPWVQLLYASSGAMTAQAGRWSWMVPPGRAVLIPAGCPHTIRMWGDVAMRLLAIPPDRIADRIDLDECRVLSVTPLLRELVLRVIEMGALDSRVAEEARLLAVLFDEIAGAEIAPLMLPLPVEPRALAVARHVLARPAEEETIDGLARRFGAGRRTLERLFRGETGISFGMWRQKARMLDSIRLLAEGKSVTEAALDTGYNSVSAFIAAFKTTFGCTPGRL